MAAGNKFGTAARTEVLFFFIQVYFSYHLQFMHAGEIKYKNYK
jgi:hypothetical protein